MPYAIGLSRVRSSRRSAGEARYLVLLHRHTTELLSSRFTDTRVFACLYHGHVFGAGDIIVTAVASRSLQSGSIPITKYDDFCHGHAVLSQRNTKNSTKHNRNCK